MSCYDLNGPSGRRTLSQSEVILSRSSKPSTQGLSTQRKAGPAGTINGQSRRSRSGVTVASAGEWIPSRPLASVQWYRVSFRQLRLSRSRLTRIYFKCVYVYEACKKVNKIELQQSFLFHVTCVYSYLAKLIKNRSARHDQRNFSAVAGMLSISGGHTVHHRSKSGISARSGFVTL
jgi:hypothetical protein